MTARAATVTRATRETSITVTLTLEGTGKADVKTGVGFLDHLLDALTRHARFDLTLASRSTTTTAPKTARSRWVRRSIGPWGSGGASTGSVGRTLHSTRRWHAPWWISRVARTRT